jgi:hypothetical protein
MDRCWKLSRYLPKVSAQLKLACPRYRTSGPVLVPPLIRVQVLELKVGGSFVEGGVVHAALEYCGGVQASAGSDYSWVRVRDNGKRYGFTAQLDVLLLLHSSAL